MITTNVLININQINRKYSYFAILNIICLNSFPLLFTFEMLPILELIHEVLESIKHDLTNRP